MREIACITLVEELTVVTYHVIHSSLASRGCFVDILPSFDFVLIQFYQFLLLESVLIFPALVFCILRKPEI